MLSRKHITVANKQKAISEISFLLIATHKVQPAEAVGSLLDT